MKRNKSEGLLRVEENHFFYICLLLVLAVAALGLIADLTAGR